MLRDVGILTDTAADVAKGPAGTVLPAGSTFDIATFIVIWTVLGANASARQPLPAGLNRTDAPLWPTDFPAGPGQHSIPQSQWE